MDFPLSSLGSFPNDDGDDDGDECVTGDDIQWEEDYETVPFDNEFSATIAAAGSLLMVLNKLVVSLLLLVKMVKLVH